MASTDPVSFITRLNTLAKDHFNSSNSLLPVTETFATNNIQNWETTHADLCSKFSNLQTDDEKEDWLKKFFQELFEIILQNITNKVTLPLQKIAKTINELCLTKSPGSRTNYSSMVGKLFIAVSSSIPTISNTGTTDLLILLKSIPMIQDEIFKFSWLSSKLISKNQTALLRHLLKKSKYELKKFNLFFENSVGYSELAVLFFMAYSDSDNFIKIDYYLDQMYMIIGKFSLDSLRSLDLFLIVSNEYLTNHYRFIIEFLKRSDFWPKSDVENIVAANIVAFYLNKNNSVTNSNEEFTNQEEEEEDIQRSNNHQTEFVDNYIDLCCLLIKNGFIEFLTLWHNLVPEIEDLESFLDDFENNLELASMKGIENPLAMAAALTMDDDDNYSSDKRSRNVQKEEGIEVAVEETDKEEKLEKEKENIRLRMLNSGKIKLLKRLLTHGCLEESIFILQKYPRVKLIDDEIPKLLVRIFEYIIEPMYEKTQFSRSINRDNALSTASSLIAVENEILSVKPKLYTELKVHDPFCPFELNTSFQFYYPEWSQNLKQVNSMEEFFKISHELYSLLGPSLAKGPTLITKLCRIGIFDIYENKESTETIEKWVDYVRTFIFPTIPVLESNPMVTTEIYSIMKFFPFERRYFMYNEMMTKLSQDSLIIKVNFNKAEREAKVKLKILSTDTIDQEAREFSKLISTNPLATLVPIVKQIENYDKVAELIIITTKLFNDFAYDVLQYVILSRLTLTRPAVQFDGVNQATWVSRLATFIAGLAKNSPNMDITNIITYITKTLHNGNIIAVTALKELIITVSGIRDQNNINSKCLIMLNSGSQLKRAARKIIFDFRDDNFPLASNLVSYFARQNAISEIILLLFKLNLAANTQDFHYKILSSRCDEMNTLLWSFIELVKFCYKNNEAAFEENVIGFNTLINEYHFPTSWAFHIWRDYFENQSRKLEEFKGTEDEPQFTELKEKTDHNDKVLMDAQYVGPNLLEFPKDFFITFWKLSLYDIRFDKTLYDELKEDLETEKLKCTFARRKHILSNHIKELLINCISHQRTFNKTKQMFEGTKTAGYERFSEGEIRTFLQFCIIPRAIFSPSDALYSSYFILQVFDTQNMFEIYGILFNSKILPTLLFSCTTSEASNLGIFFMNLLESLESNRKQSQYTNEECQQIFTWYCSLTDQIVQLLMEKNYMSIRNGIEFMRLASNVFPVIDSHIGLVSKILEANLVSEEREDIILPTNALLGHLKARLRKHLVKEEDVYKFDELERKAKELHDAEIEEIKAYHTLLQNEKKETELRKKLEFNKKRREESQKRVAENSVPADEESKNKYSTMKRSELPNGKVLTLIDRIARSLVKGEVVNAIDMLEDGHEKDDAKKLLRMTIPIREFRHAMFEIFLDYFKSVLPTNHGRDVDDKFDYLSKVCQHIPEQRNATVSDIYAETTGDEKSNRVSRYNLDNRYENRASATGREQPKSSHKNNFSDIRPSRSPTRVFSRTARQGINEQTKLTKPSSDVKGFDKSKIPAAPVFGSTPSGPSKPTAAVQPQHLPTKPSTKNPNSIAPRQMRTFGKEVPRKHELSSTMEERNMKRFKKEVPRDSSQYRRPQQDYRPPRDNSGDRSRFNRNVPSSNISHNRDPRPTADRNRPTKGNGLPQGPKGSSSGSRYQK
ncbi:Tho2p NDAI_0F03030 [Naumovozyma dairenensis CBS 421]|uniref:THO complex subunit 2 n=1 Tax=Naumovozyma dairenensis (strain ATCC 10597 / BCRC 20456 / CBS 421 / NBRC 0211 / NRRL Y-12639) TaxID=1071378 RepID=G0WCW0_NAUDC|nr:hypothetical protein NDAI_0F03030 [Naumovozyma dairenensis CBS 421]CCD25621.1 hypothetical protein NDAI_0F03030 [Naumovozyma dairenensis CBS 421]